MNFRPRESSRSTVPTPPRSPRKANDGPELRKYEILDPRPDIRGAGRRAQLSAGRKTARASQSVLCQKLDIENSQLKVNLEKTLGENKQLRDALAETEKTAGRYEEKPRSGQWDETEVFKRQAMELKLRIVKPSGSMFPGSIRFQARAAPADRRKRPACDGPRRTETLRSPDRATLRGCFALREDLDECEHRSEHGPRSREARNANAASSRRHFHECGGSAAADTTISAIAWPSACGTTSRSVVMNVRLQAGGESQGCPSRSSAAITSWAGYGPSRSAKNSPALSFKI